MLNTMELNISKKNLKILDIDSFDINIIVLKCNENKITSLPSEIGKLTNLEELLCYNNQIKLFIFLF